MRRQFAFDEHDEAEDANVASALNEEEEDEFIRYYRQFRPSLAPKAPSSSKQTASSSMTSSPAVSEHRPHQRAPHPPLQRQGSLVARLLRRGSSKKSKKTKCFLPKSRSEESRGSSGGASAASCSNNSAIHPNQNHPQTLNGLSAFSSSRSSSSLLNGHGNGHFGHFGPFWSGEDAQSRDSGNSSGGSPELRGYRKRRLANLRAAELDWYGRQRLRHNHQVLAEDRRSNQSYETARDMLDPADILLESVRCYNRDDISATASVCSSGTRRSVAAQVYPQENPFIRHQSAGGEYQETTSCWYSEDEDDPYSYRKRQQQQPLYVHRGTPSEDDHSSKLPKKSNNSKSSLLLLLSSTSILSRLSCALYSLFTTLSALFVVVALIFAWRSYNCDHDRQKSLDVLALKSELDRQLLGQHIVKEEMLKAFDEFGSNSNNNNNDSSLLVLILAGWVGSGKTLASSLLASAFPLPSNVHSFSVPLHFPRGSDHFHFLADLSLHISRSCGHSLVLFDDVDQASEETLREIAKFIVTLKNARLSSRSNGTVVAVTTAAGGRATNRHVFEAVRTGRPRESLTLREVETQALRDKSLLPTWDLLAGAAVRPRVLPFLPLARDHVRLCVEREFGRSGLSGLDGGRDEVERIVSEVEFFSDDFPVLSKRGCKDVAEKVAGYGRRLDPFITG